MEICFPSSPAPVFVFRIWRRGMYNTEIIYRTTSNLDLIFSTSFYSIFFYLDIFFSTPFYSFFFFFFPGDSCSASPSRGPTAGTGSHRAGWGDVPLCSPQPHSWQGDAHFSSSLPHPGRQRRPCRAAGTQPVPATVTQGSVGALRFITELSAAGGR